MLIGQNIVGAESVMIGYKLPGSSTVAYWSAVVDDATIGLFHYDVGPTIIPGPGILSVWPRVVMSSTVVFLSTAKVISLKAEGEV
jgi:hypothetical protein